MGLREIDRMNELDSVGTVQGPVKKELKRQLTPQEGVGATNFDNSFLLFVKILNNILLYRIWYTK
jgi:hypothetical protein